MDPERQSRDAEKVIGRSRDLLALVIVWECGAVSYRWHYNQDEAYIVLSGEGFVTNEKGVERRLGPGDVAFFAAGTNTTWRHPDHFRKVAILKESVWRPVGNRPEVMVQASADDRDNRHIALHAPRVS